MYSMPDRNSNAVQTLSTVAGGYIGDNNTDYALKDYSYRSGDWTDAQYLTLGAFTFQELTLSGDSAVSNYKIGTNNVNEYAAHGISAGTVYALPSIATQSDYGWLWLSHQDGTANTKVEITATTPVITFAQKSTRDGVTYTPTSTDWSAANVQNGDQLIVVENTKHVVQYIVNVSNSKYQNAIITALDNLFDDIDRPTGTGTVNLTVADTHVTVSASSLTTNGGSGTYDVAVGTAKAIDKNTQFSVTIAPAAGYSLTGEVSVSGATNVTKTIGNGAITVAGTAGTSNVTVTATTAANQYTITWNYDDGSATQNGSTTVSYDGTITVPNAAPTYTGHTFLGWYSANNKLITTGSTFNTTTDSGFNTDVTITAKWGENPTINYDETNPFTAFATNVKVTGTKVGETTSANITDLTNQSGSPKLSLVYGSTVVIEVNETQETNVTVEVGGTELDGSVVAGVTYSIARSANGDGDSICTYTITATNAITITKGT
jgi:uncharacterized repeat protein (TIGR02543 family)